MGREILEQYGVRFAEEKEAKDPEHAVQYAEKLGYPVALKGLGASIYHKTDEGLVFLNLNDSDAVRKAAFKIIEKAGDRLDGITVQQMITGAREFAAGMIRDKDFGPAIMFGLGGIFTEALKDHVFRLAPLTRTDAQQMLDSIKAKALLGKIRGKAEADKEVIIQTLLALSKIAVEREDITEIDINPLIVSDNGRVAAVDALVAFEKSSDKKAKKVRIPASKQGVRALFNPESIAFIGASATLGKWGQRLLSNTIGDGYKGKVYPVNPKGGEIAGSKVYKSVKDIEDKVDLAVVTIPAQHVFDLIDDLAEKNISNVLLISSGFGETGEAGRKMEKELEQKAREAGILILGPNTMGICNPHISMYSLGVPAHPKPGSVSFVSQSGNMGTQLMAFAEQQGIGIRWFAGTGNETMITVEDFIESLESDDLTKIIMLYSEGIKDGRRFFESARKISPKKPILMLKGGRTDAGNRAASSHTGAIASDNKIFESMCTQAGIVKADNSEELIDICAVFSSLPMPKSNRAAIMTLGGGWGVLTADLCAKSGILLPDLDDDIREQINKFLPDYWSKSNPVDLVGESDPKIPMEVTEALMKWDGCDGIIVLGITGHLETFERSAENFLKTVQDKDRASAEKAARTMIEFKRKFEKEYIEHVVRLMDKYEKPIFGVSLHTEDKGKIIYGIDGCRFKSVFYEDPNRAVTAFAKMHEYNQFKIRNV